MKSILPARTKETFRLETGAVLKNGRLEVSTSVSIIIPCYNKRAYVAAAIDSALAQTYACEVIVVDDGSTDGSLDELKCFGDDIRWVTGPNRGGSAARNTGLEMAHGDWIQFLDADDILPPEKIAKQLATMQAAPDGSMAFCPWAYLYDSGEIDPPSTRRYWHDYSDGASLLIDMWYHGGFFPPLAWLVPRRLIDQVGGWNEALTGDDDGEFFGRLLVAATEMRFCAETTVLYRDPPEGAVSRDRSAKAARSSWTAFECVAEALLECRSDLASRKACLSRARTTGYAWRDIPDVLDRATAWERTNRTFDFSPALPRKIRILVAFFGLKQGLKLRQLLSH